MKTILVKLSPVLKLPHKLHPLAFPCILTLIHSEVTVESALNNKTSPLINDTTDVSLARTTEAQNLFLTDLSLRFVIEFSHV